MRSDLFSDIAIGQNLNLTTRKDIPEVWPEFEALRSTVQDKDWHAEGDVLIHTEMVLNECLPLPAKDKHILYLSALLHDIAKPQVTMFEPEIQHVIAPKHERIGGIKSRYLLREHSRLSNQDRRLISDLVSTHHLVKRSILKVEEEDPAVNSFMERLAARTNTEYLYWLEMADMRGRICVDRERQLEIVELFKVACEDLNIFGKAPEPWCNRSNCSDVNFQDDFVADYVLAEAHRRRLLGELNEYSSKAFCYEKAARIGRKDIPYPADIILTIGISGSGKSSHLQHFYPEYKVISPDKERARQYGDESIQGEPGPIYQACHETLKETLRIGGKAVFDATSIIPDLRAKTVNICHDYGAKVTFLVFDTSVEDALTRNQSRERQVPEFVIESQAERFEWPLPEENHQTIVVES